MPLERPALALVLCVQPVAVDEVLREAYENDRGLVFRLRLIAPASRMSSRELNPDALPFHPHEWWGATLRRLHDLK